MRVLWCVNRPARHRRDASLNATEGCSNVLIAFFIRSCYTSKMGLIF